MLQNLEGRDASGEINDFCESVQNQAYYDAKRLFDDVNWHMMETEYTYDSSVSLKTFQLKEKTQPEFSSYVDAALVAKIYG